MRRIPRLKSVFRTGAAPLAPRGAPGRTAPRARACNSSFKTVPKIYNAPPHLGRVLGVVKLLVAVDDALQPRHLATAARMSGGGENRTRAAAMMARMMG